MIILAPNGKAFKIVEKALPSIIKTWQTSNVICPYGPLGPNKLKSGQIPMCVGDPVGVAWLIKPGGRQDGYFNNLFKFVKHSIYMQCVLTLTLLFYFTTPVSLAFHFQSLGRPLKHPQSFAVELETRLQNNPTAPPKHHHSFLRHRFMVLGFWL